MVRLKQIKIKNNTASAVYYPEDEQVGGSLSVDLKTGEVVAYTEVMDYSFNYVHHAARELQRMAKEKDTRTESTVMWY